MPCDSRPESQTEVGQRKMREALERLRAALVEGGSVSVVIGASGAIAFRGWEEGQREGMTDACAYRKLLAMNSPELRRAVMRAETIYGRKVNQQAIAQGVHSHDGGHTWGTH